MGTATLTATSTQDTTKFGSASVSIGAVSVSYRLFGVDYGPYLGSQSAGSGSAVTDAEIEQQLKLIAPDTEDLNYQCTGLEDVPSIELAGLGLGVYLGVCYLPPMTPPTSSSESSDCVAIAKAVGVQAIVVGSEALLNNYVSPDQLIAYINQVRAAVPLAHRLPPPTTSSLS